MADALPLSGEQLVQEAERRVYPKIKFEKPISAQRYQRVTDILQELITERSQTQELPLAEAIVLEVGCGPLALHKYLKQVVGLDRVIYLDKDETLIQICKCALEPTICEIVEPRTTPFRAQLYAGDIANLDPVIVKSDIHAVVGVEVVEHFDERTLRGFEKSVFGMIYPPVVIVTTPNAEFNTVFNITSRFRHWDHKFEWTRAEFSDWCETVCKNYPGYGFKIEGIGKWDPGEIEFGCVTQLAVFRLNAEALAQRRANFLVTNKAPFKLIADVDYPFDNSPLKAKILKAFKYYVFNKGMLNDSRVISHIDSDNSYADIPLNILTEMQLMPKTNITEEDIRSALEEEGYTLIQTGPNNEMFVRLELSSVLDNTQTYETEDEWASHYNNLDTIDELVIE